MNVKVNNRSFWNELYQSSSDGWDIGTPTPIFLDLLENNFFAKDSSILIIGCGKGYDAIAAAKFGYDVTGLDFSDSAIEFAKSLSLRENLKINFITQDLFTVPDKIKNSFDYLYDYVTYCAIDPKRRKEYVKSVAGLLKPGGIFVIILFPVEKREGGPPFSVNVDEVKKIFSEYFILIKEETEINSIKPRKGREVLHIYKKVK